MASKSQQKSQSGKPELISEQVKELNGLKEQVLQLRKEIDHKNQAIMQATAKHERTVCGLLNELKSLICSHSEETSQKARLDELDTAVMQWSSYLRKYAIYQETNKQPSDHLQKHFPHSTQPFQQLDCQSLTLDYEALQSQAIQRERDAAQNILASQQLDYLQSELRRQQSRSEQLLRDGQKWKEETFALSTKLASNQVELRRVTQQNIAIKHKNRQLYLQLEACKQQLGLASNMLQSLKRENKRLADQHRQSLRSQQVLNSIIAENQREIQKICTEAYRLKLEIHSFQLKFKEIVENDEKQKALQLLKPKKTEQKFILCEVPTQNTIDSLHSKTSKLDAARLMKVNLHFYQQKLMNLSSAASIYLS